MYLVIGNGLIAQAFLKELRKSNILNNDLLIFASGVSNSLETKAEIFQRELDLIKDTLNKNLDSHLVYFSSCFVSKIDSPYARHKLKIEEYIQNNSKKFSIFRLPQVVGLVNNKTIVSNFTKKIINKEKLMIQKYSLRNLIDVDDIARIVIFLLNKKEILGKTINISNSMPISPKEIAIYIGKILDIKPNLIEVNDGYQQNVDISILIGLISEDDKIFKKDYWKDILIKYVPILKKNFF